MSKVKVNGLEWEELNEGVLVRISEDHLTLATVAQLDRDDNSAELGFESVTLWGEDITALQDFLMKHDTILGPYMVKDRSAGTEAAIRESEELDRMYGGVVRDQQYFDRGHSSPHNPPTLEEE